MTRFMGSPAPTGEPLPGEAEAQARASRAAKEDGGGGGGGGDGAGEASEEEAAMLAAALRHLESCAFIGLMERYTHRRQGVWRLAKGLARVSLYSHVHARLSCPVFAGQAPV
jgi:hypothetical protein